MSFLSQIVVSVWKLVEVGDDGVITEEFDRIIQHVTYVKYKGT